MSRYFIFSTEDTHLHINLIQSDSQFLLRFPHQKALPYISKQLWTEQRLWVTLYTLSFLRKTNRWHHTRKLWMTSSWLDGHQAQKFTELYNLLICAGGVKLSPFHPSRMFYTCTPSLSTPITSCPGAANECRHPGWANIDIKHGS